MKNILIIDDSPDFLILETIIFKKSGFHVETALNGSKALELIEKIEKPDIILLDLCMEGMGGMDFLNCLKMKHPAIYNDVPIVWQTGSEKVPETVAVGFIRKPSSIEFLVSEVRRHILNNAKVS